MKTMTNYNDIKLYRDDVCGGKLELYTHQSFLANFINPNTPYKGLLMFHGTGTGKTGSAISIAENFKDMVKKYNTKRNQKKRNQNVNKEEVQLMDTLTKNNLEKHQRKNLKRKNLKRKNLKRKNLNVNKKDKKVMKMQHMQKVNQKRKRKRKN